MSTLIASEISFLKRVAKHSLVPNGDIAQPDGDIGGIYTYYPIVTRVGGCEILYVIEGSFVIRGTDNVEKAKNSGRNIYRLRNPEQVMLKSTRVADSGTYIGKIIKPDLFAYGQAALEVKLWQGET